MSWEWDNVSRRYRNTGTGRYLSPAQMETLRDGFMASQQQYAAYLAREVVAGDISRAEWLDTMRQQIGTTYIDSYILARGGRAQMTGDDWTRLERMLGTQYGHLDKLADRVPDLTEDQIAQHSGRYIAAAGQAYSAGQAAAIGVPDLPAQPKDGSSECKDNCGCEWDIQAVEGGWDCYWRRSKDDSCDTCLQREADWNPLHVRAA